MWHESDPNKHLRSGAGPPAGPASRRGRSAGVRLQSSGTCAFTQEPSTCACGRTCCSARQGARALSSSHAAPSLSFPSAAGLQQQPHWLLDKQQGATAPDLSSGLCAAKTGLPPAGPDGCVQTHCTQGQWPTFMPDPSTSRALVYPSAPGQLAGGQAGTPRPAKEGCSVCCPTSAAQRVVARHAHGLEVLGSVCTAGLLGA